MLDVSDVVMADPRELRTAPPFSTVFAVKPDVQDPIVESMKTQGYDPTKPVAVWREQNVVIDGHTRILSAIKARITDIPVVFFSFASEDDAMLYAITSQIHRRNLSQSEFLSAVKAVDKIKARGGDRCSEKAKTSREVFAPATSSAAETAKILGVGRATIERARTVLSDEEATEAVMQGKASINMAARNVKAKKPKKQKSAETICGSSADAPVAETKAAALASAPPLPFAERADPPFVAVSTEKPRWDTQQYRMDVRIYNELGLDKIRERLIEITGVEGSEVYGPLYQRVHALISVAPPKFWVDCPRCNATGTTPKAMPCKACRRGRYHIPANI